MLIENSRQTELDSYQGQSQKMGTTCLLYTRGERREGGGDWKEKKRPVFGFLGGKKGVRRKIVEKGVRGRGERA